MKKTKWYQKWYYIIGVIVLIVGLYFAIRKGSDVYEQISLNSILLKKVESTEKEMSVIDSLYQLEKAKKEKIRIIREKIDITDDLKKLQSLIGEYEALKRDTIPTNKPTSQELLDYINKEF